MARDNSYTSLKAELAAIEHWDFEYFQRDNHERSDVNAYEGRKRRRDEILKQIQQSDFSQSIPAAK